MPLSLRTGAFSDIGRTRKKNDDSGYAGTYFVMVADGMGGAPAGDLASAVAVQTMQRLDGPPQADLLEALAGAVHRANEKLGDLIDEDSSVEGMGTTVTAVLFDGAQIGVAHMGDSRGYLWRDGELLRLTQDHTWVQSLIDEGRITEEEAKTHSHRSLLLKVLDGRHDNDPDLTLFEVQPGDRILLCSDGLSGFVDHPRIAEVLAAGSAEEAARELTQLALDSHSTDNVTVVVADVVDEPPTDGFVPLVVGAAAEDAPGRFARFRSWTQRDHEGSHETLAGPEFDPEELRYAPREPRRFRWLKRGLVAIVVLALVLAGGAYAYSWTQDQYYVAEHDGKVAIYQGIQADLPGIQLHSVHSVEDISLVALPSFRRSQVIEGLTADDLPDAERIVAQLETFADRCAEQATQTTRTPTTPAPTTDRSPDGSDGTGKAGDVTASPSPTRRTTEGGGTGTAGAGQQSSPTRRTDTQGTTVAPTTGSDTGGEEGEDDECAGVTPDTETSR
ncbi:MAG: PP2C family protein-serine/threonine phosphatase [Nocardioidaceae bacterium]